MKKIFKNYAIMEVYFSNKAILLSVLMQNNFSYYSIEANSKNIKLFIPLRKAEKLLKCLNSNNIKAKIVDKKGIVPKFNRIKKRPGILIGFLIMIVITFFSSKIVWSIEIEGNKNISNEKILSALNDAGLKLGSFIPHIDYDNLHNNVLINLKDLSWISVNIDGNKAKVTVEETKKEENESLPTYSNIIASSDAQIHSIIVSNGEKIINIGDIVKKGELLVSGVLDSQTLGVRYVDAKAKIIGYVNKKIEVSIPLKTIKKKYTGNERTSIEYKLFNNICFFSINYGNLPSNYDTIINEEYSNFFGITNIPYKMIITKHLEYYEEEYTYSMQEAVDLAFLELRGKLDICLKDAELISKNIKTNYDEEKFYIFCDIYCLEDIGEIKTIQVNSY